MLSLACRKPMKSEYRNNELVAQTGCRQIPATGNYFQGHQLTCNVEGRLKNTIEVFN